jgi:cellobiose transport system substrate-binding protein
MRATTRRRRHAALAFTMTAVLTAGTACGGAGDSGDGKIELTVSVFGQFGYEKLYDEYERTHPDIRITERGTGSQLSNYTPRLTQQLAAGSGAGDVVAIEEGILVQFAAQPQHFVDLADHGAAGLEGNFLPWKWEQGHAADGKLIGLGTDIGSMAMCYRRDLFSQAGLPTERDEVSKLWPEWEDFIATGERFEAAGTKAEFLDAGSNVYNTILMQQGDHTYFDRDGKLVMGTNPGVERAYDLTVRMIEGGLSAGYKSFSDQWTAGFKNSAFATTACPAWMLGVIEGNAGPANKGKWDVAAVPGGGGNWGGSFLAVPVQGDHPEEAAELAEFLTSPAGQLAAFRSKNTLPSSPQALDDPVLLGATNAYFSGAPVGQIFGAGAKEQKPVYMGPKNQAVRDLVENTLLAIQQGQLRPGQAWAKALADAEREAGR